MRCLGTPHAAALAALLDAGGRLVELDDDHELGADLVPTGRPLVQGDLHALAVADDGRLAVINAGKVEVHAPAGELLSAQAVPGDYCDVAWSGNELIVTPATGLPLAAPPSSVSGSSPAAGASRGGAPPSLARAMRLVVWASAARDSGLFRTSTGSGGWTSSVRSSDWGVSLTR